MSQTVHKMWDPQDPLGILNVDRDPKNSAVRYGVSYWLWGDDDIKKQIVDHFQITG